MSGLPSGWVLTTVSDVGEVTLGRQRSPQHHAGDHMRPYLRVANVFENRIDTTDVKEMNFTPEEFPRFALRRGDILLNEGQSRELVGRPAMFQDEVPGACFQNTLVRFRARGAVLPEYALAVFRSYFHTGQFERICKWTTNIAHLGAERFASMPFPLAPLSEQKRIADKLDALLARVDACRERLDRVPLLLKRFRQAVLAAATSGELTEEWRDDSSEQSTMSERSLPSGWMRMRVEELASSQPRSIQSGPFGSHLKHKEFQAKGVLAIGIDNVGQGRFLAGRQNRISMVKFAQLDKFKARPNDVLITVMATVGRCCVVPADVGLAIITKHVYRVSVNSEIVSPYFLMFSLMGALETTDYIEGKTIGQTRPGINGDILKRAPVKVPPRDEQDEIVRRVESLFAYADRLEARYQAARAHVYHLTPAILAKAFLGNLVPQDPNDEPASVLLERIRAGRPLSGRPALSPRPSPPRGEGGKAPPPVGGRGWGEGAPSTPRSIPETILAHMHPGRAYSRSELCDALCLSSAEWTWAIRDLKESGRVVQEGARRGSTYTLAA